MTDIRQTFGGKNLFCTGVTGFLGKVLLFKVLKEFPDVGTVYCLCRPKKNVTMQQRFEKEVLSSPCFEPLIKQIGQEEWNRRSAKLRPIAGDLTVNRLGLSPADYSLICDNAHIIIHLAATVDFNEKLPVSVNMNVLGSVRVLALAQRCPNLIAFVHTSTAYVNFPRHGGASVVEQLYPMDFDAESMAKYIMALHEDQISAETARLLTRYGYPNTYTFTKNLTEHILAKHRGTLPMAIVRPSIVGAAWTDPCNGWVDALTSAGGIFLTIGLGICQDLVGDRFSPTDVIPVDHVVNIIIKAAWQTAAQHKAAERQRSAVAAEQPQQAYIHARSASRHSVPEPKEFALSALFAKRGRSPDRLPTTLASSAHENALPRPESAMLSTEPFPGDAPRPVAQVAVPEGKNSLEVPSVLPIPVYHATTSATGNPLCWETIRLSIVPYWRGIKHPKAVAPPSVTFHSNFRQYDAAVFLKHRLPLAAARLMNRLPGIHSEKQDKMLQRYERAIFRCDDLNRQFHPFMRNTWRFECSEAAKLDEGLSRDDRRAFSHDVFDINWHHYAEAYSWGLMRFIMKEDRPAPALPTSGSEVVLKAFL